MAYPDKYTRQYDFVAYQNANPTRPLPADKVNADLNAVELSVGEIVDFLKVAVRSDGMMANESIGRDQLTTDLQTLIDGANGNISALATLVAAIVTMTASRVTFTPVGSISATDVQAALTEHDSETTAALALKAPLASPTFTGVPAAPTAAPGTNTTQVSTTAFTKAAIDVVLGGVSASFDTLSEIVAGMQPLDATLTALAAITTAADKLIYATGSDAFATTTFTAAGRALVDDADAAAQRTTLGVGTADNPQFATIELGAASDTTLARVSAGVVSIEGSNILLASGLGSITQAFDADLSALAANSTDGFWAHTGAGTGAARTFSAGTGITISNPAGIAGNPSFALAAAQFSTVSALADGATPALDASLGNIFTLAAAGDRTIAVPTSATNGQKIVIRHLASGGVRTLALNTGASGFRFGSDITALTATASGKTDYIGAIYSSIDSKWDVVAYAKGY